MSEKLVKSAVRVLAIFEAFEAEQRALTISELVDFLQIPQSSMSTLIKSLVIKGFVEYDAETRRYRPSIRLAFLGNWALGSTDVIARIHSLAQRLHEETGETVLVGAENGLYTQYLSVLLSPSTLRFALHPGILRPIHRSGLGVMLLSRKTDSEIGRIVRRYNAELQDPDEPRSAESDVLARVATARQQGWFFNEHTLIRGGGSIATLLNLPDGLHVLAIGFGGPVPALSARVDTLRDILVSTVKGFEREILQPRPVPVSVRPETVKAS